MQVIGSDSSILFNIDDDSPRVLGTPLEGKHRQIGKISDKINKILEV